MFLNTKETALKQIQDYNFIGKRSSYFKKYVYFICCKCNQVKEKRLYPEKDNFGLDFICRECRYKQTSLDKYGVSNPTKTKQVHDKMVNTCIERYGVENPSYSEQVIEKIKQNNKASLDTTKEKRKQTNLHKYGVEFAQSADCVKQKAAETNMKRYGVKAPCQNYDILKKCFKNIKYDNIYFDSSWEVAYYIWCKRQGKDIKRNTKMYKLSNGTYCNPDFLVDNQLIEIKGDHLKKSQNYKYKKEFYEKNNVKVLSYDDLYYIFKEVYSEMKEKGLPLPKLQSKRGIIEISSIDEIEEYKHKNVKFLYVCTNCKKMNITGYEILKHFNNLLCKSCRKESASNTEG